MDEALRRLGLVTVDGTEQHELIAERTYDTDVKDLWDAVTSAERIPRWFMPVEGDLRVGGRYQLTGNAGGEILECVPPERFRITWEFGGQSSLVEVTFAATAGGASVRLKHTAAVPERMWQQFGPGAVGMGWDSGFLGLTWYLDDPRAPRDEAKIQAWLAGAEGVAFLTASGEAWRDADVAAGADPQQAQAAFERCLAAYTGA